MINILCRKMRSVISSEEVRRLEKDKAVLRKARPFNAAITREQFLFYEMRTTAKLLSEGL